MQVSFAANLSNTVTFIVMNISLISAGKQWRALVRDSNRLPASSLKRFFFFLISYECKWFHFRYLLSFKGDLFSKK